MPRVQDVESGTSPSLPLANRERSQTAQVCALDKRKDTAACRRPSVRSTISGPWPTRWSARPARPPPTPSPLRDLNRQPNADHMVVQTRLTVSLARAPSHSCPFQRLIIRQCGQDAKNHRRPRLQLHPHQPMRHRVADVFKVHRRALDQAPNRDDRVERSRRGGSCVFLFALLGRARGVG
jgi:hypothetical protein